MYYIIFFRNVKRIMKKTDAGPEPFPAGKNGKDDCADFQSFPQVRLFSAA